MKLSQKKETELKVWEYFIPNNVAWEEKTDEDIVKFFEWSEQGKHKTKSPYGDFSYFEALRQGKRWAGIHIHEMWEGGVLEGSTPYFVLLGGEDTPMPRHIVDFMKKEIFKGQDAKIIEDCYQLILND